MGLLSTEHWEMALLLFMKDMNGYCILYIDLVNIHKDTRVLIVLNLQICFDFFSFPCVWPLFSVQNVSTPFLFLHSLHNNV